MSLYARSRCIGVAPLSGHRPGHVAPMHQEDPLPGAPGRAKPLYAHGRSALAHSGLGGHKKHGPESVRLPALANPRARTPWKNCRSAASLICFSRASGTVALGVGPFPQFHKPGKPYPQDTWARVQWLPHHKRTQPRATRGLDSKLRRSGQHVALARGFGVGTAIRTWLPATVSASSVQSLQ